jgi:uncharacterized membrane protein
MAAPAQEGIAVRKVFLLLILSVVLSASAHAGTGEQLARSLQTRGLSPEAVVLLVSMLPIVELRGALPIGHNLFGLPLWKTLVLSVVGNMVPIFVLVLFLERLTVWLSRVALFRRFFDWLFRRTRARSGTIAKYEFWGLAIFVGIPLPGTGAWTGAVAAVAMGLPYWRSLLSIFIGVLMAAVLVTGWSLLYAYNRVWALLIVAAVVLYVSFEATRAALRRRRARRPAG